MTVLAPTSTASTLDTWSGLQGAVISWSHRSDITTILPNCLLLAESAIRRDVRCRAQEVSTSGTLTSSSLTAPTDLLEIRRLLVDDCVQTYLTPGEWYLRREDSNDQYTLIGETIYFQSTSGDYQIDYYEAFDPLVNDNDSNWLLQNYPDIYLFGILAEVAIWSREDPSFFQSRYRSIVENIRRVENLNRYPTQPAVRAVGMTVY